MVRKVIQMLPNGGTARMLQVAMGIFDEALEIENKGRLDEAMDLYVESIALFPNAFSYINIGRIWHGRGDHNLAESFYKKALGLNPCYSMAWYNLGCLYEEQGLQKKAQDFYLEALNCNPVYRNAHYNLALIFQKNRHFMQALHHWRAYGVGDPISEWGHIADREAKKIISQMRRDSSP